MRCEVSEKEAVGGRCFWWSAYIVLCCAAILLINVLRFVALDSIPYGAQVDEIAGAVTLECLASEGVTPNLQKPGLFIDLNFGSPKPPTFLYPGLVWVKLFGSTIASVRAYSGFWALVAIVGMFFLGRCFWGTRCGLLAAFLATISPWLWMFSRVAYESIAGPACFVWGLFFFFRSSFVKDALVASFFISAAMYAYPPMRVSVPLIILPMFAYRAFCLTWSWKQALLFSGGALVLSLPLAQGILSGALQQRFQDISILSPEYLTSLGKTASLPDVASLFWANYWTHFNGDFLFLTGDRNLIHTTGHAGILSWGDMCGLFLLCFCLVGDRLNKAFSRKQRLSFVMFAGFCVIGILLGVVPSAMTAFEIPHVLRSIGSWPFVLLLAAFGICRAIEYWRPFGVAVLGFSLLFSVSFLGYYFGEYALASRGMFGFWSKEMAEAARTEQDWQAFMLAHRNSDYHFQYYLMHYKEETCSSSRNKWLYLRQMLALRPA